MNNGQRLALPGQLNVGFQQMPGPNAYPVQIQLQGPGGVQVISVGGLTKLEAVAAQIAGGWALDGLEIDAEAIVTVAAKILAECERRQKKSKENQC